jgi:large subunit ribosomal protein L32
MAVPKKKMSKSRRDSRKSYWKKKVVRNVILAISLGKSIKTGKPNHFVLDKSFYPSLIKDKSKIDN